MKQSAPRPIVWFHKGHCWYLPWAVIQAQTSNPCSPQIILSDVPVKVSGAEWVDTKDYWSEAAAFEQVYRHYSVMPPTLELSSIQRWFVLRQWMETHDVARCFFVDVDVLIYCDVEADAERFADADATQLPGNGPINGHINQRDFLDRFCSYLMRLYAEPAAIVERITQIRAAQPHANVNDMSLYQWFREQDAVKSADFCARDEISGGEHTAQIERTASWRARGRYKKLVWRNGLPHAIRTTGEEVRMLSLHINGLSKPLMPRYCMAPSAKRWPLLPAFWRALPTYWPSRLIILGRRFQRLGRRILGRR